MIRTLPLAILLVLASQSVLRADLAPLEADGLRSVLIRGRVIASIDPPATILPVSEVQVSEPDTGAAVLPATSVAKEPTPAPASTQPAVKPSGPRDPKDAIRDGVRGRELREIIRRWRDR